VDELADKYAEAKELKKSLSTLLSFRPFLEITAIVVSLLLGQWMIWVTVISFDLAYILATRVVPKMLSKN
jgi:hypothetical protein